jgi:hypothetical protein
VDRITVRFTAGGGLTYAITDNLIDKIEYRYYDLGTYHRDSPTNGACCRILLPRPIGRCCLASISSSAAAAESWRETDVRGMRETETSRSQFAGEECMIASSVQVVLVALATTIAVAVRPAEAADKHLKHKAHSSVHARSTQGRAAPRHRPHALLWGAEVADVARSKLISPVNKLAGLLTYCNGWTKPVLASHL